MIHSHLYTNKSITPLFSKPGDIEPCRNLGPNSWVGVFDKLDGLYHVLTIKGEGWVHMEDVEERSPFNLHIRWEAGRPIEYVSAA